MAFDAGAAIGWINIETKKAKKGVDDLKGGVDSLGKRVEKNREHIRKLGIAIATAGAAATATGVMLAKSFIKASNAIEQYELRLRALLGTQAEGARLFKEMADYAAQVPFTYEKIMESATALSGIMEDGADDVIKWMPLIADLSAAVGLSIEVTTAQIARMYSAGAQAADRFRERGISAMLGFKGGVQYTAEETRKVLMESWTKMDSQFKGAAKSLATTWTGIMSMIEDKWFQFRDAFMQETGMWELAKAGLQEIDDAMGAVTKSVVAFGKENRTLTFAIVSVGAALSAATLSMGTFMAIAPSVTSIVKLWQAGFFSWGVAVGGVAAALTALIGVIVAFKAEQRAARNEMAAAAKSAVGNMNAVLDLTRRYENVTRLIAKYALDTEKAKTLTADLTKVKEQLITTLAKEGILIQDWVDLQRVVDEMYSAQVANINAETTALKNEIAEKTKMVRLDYEVYEKLREGSWAHAEMTKRITEETKALRDRLSVVRSLRRVLGEVGKTGGKQPIRLTPEEYDAASVRAAVTAGIATTAQEMEQARTAIETAKKALSDYLQLIADYPDKADDLKKIDLQIGARKAQADLDKLLENQAKDREKAEKKSAAALKKYLRERKSAMEEQIRIETTGADTLREISQRVEILGTEDQFDQQRIAARQAMENTIRDAEGTQETLVKIYAKAQQGYLLVLEDVDQAEEDFERKRLEREKKNADRIEKAARQAAMQRVRIAAQLYNEIDEKSQASHEFNMRLIELQLDGYRKLGLDPGLVGQIGAYRKEQERRRHTLGTGTFFEGLRLQAQKSQEEMKSGAEVAVRAYQDMETAWGSFFENSMSDLDSFGDHFRQFALDILSAWRKTVAQMAAQQMMLALTGKQGAGGGGGGFNWLGLVGLLGSLGGVLGGMGSWFNAGGGGGGGPIGGTIGLGPTNIAQYPDAFQPTDGIGGPGVNSQTPKEQPVVIYNMITNEAVAASMQSREGRGVIVNAVNRDSLENGVTRRTIRRAGA